MGSSTAMIGVDDVTTTDVIDKVYAVITGPAPAFENTTVELMPANVKGLISNGRYEVNHNGFGPTSGTYEVAVYAQDMNGNQSFQELMTVEQQVGPDGYQDDDSAANASVIFVDDVFVQPHNFHDDGDTDWAQFYAVQGEFHDLVGTHLTD